MLYDESQGIADLAIKLYELAQIEAITRATTGEEEVITKQLLHRTGEEITEKLKKYEDIAVIDLNEVVREAKDKTQKE